MTDCNDASVLFGLDGPDSAYYQDSGAAAEANGNSNGGDGHAHAHAPNPAGDHQQLFCDSNWSFQQGPPYDSYDTNPFFHEGWGMNQQMPMLDGVEAPQSVSGPVPPPSMAESCPPAYAMTTPVASPDIAQSYTTAPPPTVSLLSDEQRQRLQKIAMPATIPYHSPRSEPSPNSAVGAGKSSISSSPEGMREFDKSNTRKRKSSEDDGEDDDDDDAHQPVKKTAHNMIEKRYRTNLNDKIAALRDSVPSLRIMSKSARGEDTTEDREELHGLTPAHKLNKATVLSKATEYIRHLEKRNSRLMDENSAMQQRIAAFEKLFISGAMSGAIPQRTPSTPTPYSQQSANFAPSPMATPNQPDTRGMIPVPDDMKPILAAQMATGQPYPVPQQVFRQAPLVRQQQIHHQQQHMQAEGWQHASPYYGKMIVGSLAALMLLEAVRENEQSNESPGGRGLFALPIHLLRYLTSQLSVNFMGYSIHGARVIFSIKVVLLLCSLWWAFMPSLMDSKPTDSKKTQQTRAEPKAAPSLASPIHVRRRAWLTAIQTVWVPRHNFFLEATALSLKTLKLSVRNLIGVQGYQMLTGLTEEQEIARVKAWEIALDAQLAGGDVEISKSRLTLTLLASGTLPTTPLRLMLKALHIRVLLWELGLTGVRTGVQVIAAKLARSKWNEAQQLYRITTQLRRQGHELPDDDLPDHLAALLEQDCDEVLNSTVIQRAHNLAWNCATEKKAIGSFDGMNAVTDDLAVRSPMDAVAAWWSSMTLQGVLAASLLDSEDDNDEISQHIEHVVSLAIRAAPIGSVAQQRALVAQALLSDKNRSINIVAALQAIGPVTPALASSDDAGMANREGSSTPLKELPPCLVTTAEIRTSLLCAMAIAHLQKYSPPDEPVIIYGVIDQIQPACDMGLLGYISAYKLMDHLAKHEFAAEACASTLERLAGTLRIWTGKESALDPDIRQQIVDRCLSVTRGIVGMDFENSETDTGYGSMSEIDSDYGTISDPEPEPEPESIIETAVPCCGCAS